MPLWRSVLRLRCPTVYASAPGRGSSFSSSFHSTPVYAAKWKAKFDYDKNEGKNQQPSKNYVRYIVRQKRSDAKRVLNEFLLKGGYKRNVQAEWESWYVGPSRSSSHSDGGRSSDHERGQPHHPGGGRPKTEKQSSRKAKQNGKRRKKWNFVSDDDQYAERIFETAFGDKRYTWSFRSRNESDSQSSTTGFKWRDGSDWGKDGQGSNGTRKQTSYWTNNRRDWYSESDVDDEEEDVGVESFSMGSRSHRVVLGLPTSGPLKLDDVKSAFRTSALKWHPDKHQGPSQAAAVEKFRLCVEAYNSLCSSFNAA